MPRSVVLSILLALAFAPAASAHVTLNPPEWEGGGFARFAVRVPNERDNADTIEVSVQFPENVISASFQPAPGWKRTVQMTKLETPIEEEGEEPITERIATVTWSGGKIAPGEFQEFGVSFRVPEEPGTNLVFPAVQTYSNGEVVRWIGPEDSDTPAPIVAVTEAAEERTEGEQTAQPPSADDEAKEDDDNGLAVAALALGIAGLLAGLAALALVVRRPRPGS
jgi:periplasmic copper chaperone A